jgi:hypothetical protein
MVQHGDKESQDTTSNKSENTFYNNQFINSHSGISRHNNKPPYLHDFTVELMRNAVYVGIRKSTGTNGNTRSNIMRLSQKSYAQSQLTITGARITFPFPLIDTWCIFVDLGPGTRTIEAHYAGDSGHESSSATRVVTVTS